MRQRNLLQMPDADLEPACLLETDAIVQAPEPAIVDYGTLRRIVRVGQALRGLTRFKKPKQERYSPNACIAAITLGSSAAPRIARASRSAERFDPPAARASRAIAATTGSMPSAFASATTSGDRAAARISRTAARGTPARSPRRSASGSPSQSMWLTN